jgi:hypothetical protein
VHDCSGTQAAETLELVPYFEAGNQEQDAYRDGHWFHTERVSKITYQVWLPYRCHPTPE